MFFHKICFRCQEKKPFQQFQKDRKTADGFRASCKDCLNTQRRNERVRAPAKKVKVPIIDERQDTLTLLEKIQEKYQSFMTISLSREGIYRMQIHYKEKNIHFTGKNIMDVLLQAARSNP